MSDCLFVLLDFFPPAVFIVSQGTHYSTSCCTPTPVQDSPHTLYELTITANFLFGASITQSVRKIERMTRKKIEKKERIMFVAIYIKQQEKNKNQEGNPPTE